MKTSCTRFYFFAVILLTFEALAFQMTTISNGIDRSFIRVRIFENLSQVSITGRRVAIVNNTADYKKVSLNSDFGEVQSVEIAHKQKWDQSFFLVKKDQTVSELKSGHFFIKGNDLKVGEKPLANFIQIFKHDQGFDIIAYVPMRDYLKGVVGSEMPKNWPNETLKAQIVAARSYALSMSEKRKKNSFDVESTVKDQVYQHDDDSRLEPLLDQTAHLVLFDQKNKILKAYYHSECGGQTSSAKKVFGDADFDDEVRDPYCSGRPWKFRIAKSSLEDLIGPFQKVVSAFDPLRRAYNVGVKRAEVQIGQSERIENWSAQKIRMILGSTKMKSTWFEMKTNGNAIEFKGKGYGHGVGLCQWGSRKMGLMKKSFQEILHFYYPSSTLKVVKSNF